MNKNTQKSKLYTKQFLTFERNGITDEELSLGKLKGENLNKATWCFFIFYELLLIVAAYIYNFDFLKMLSLSIMALMMARQTALDFAYHVMLDSYNFIMALFSVILAVAVFDFHSFSTAITTGLSLGFVLFMFTVITSLILKRPAGLGFADAKFAVSIGAFLGSFLSYICILISTVLNFALTFTYKKGEEVPMGPGLLVAFWICLLFKQPILQTVWKFIG
jgi:prepilin signal peptidase PulO-like enzyme (type II secretory pathway)